MTTTLKQQHNQDHHNNNKKKQKINRSPSVEATLTSHSLIIISTEEI